MLLRVLLRVVKRVALQVALDGEIIAREPNGDVIDVSPPAWRDWIKNVEAGRD